MPGFTDPALSGLHSRNPILTWWCLQGRNSVVKLSISVKRLKKATCRFGWICSYGRMRYRNCFGREIEAEHIVLVEARILQVRPESARFRFKTVTARKRQISTSLYSLYGKSLPEKKRENGDFRNPILHTVRNVSSRDVTAIKISRRGDIVHQSVPKGNCRCC